MQRNCARKENRGNRRDVTENKEIAVIIPTKTRSEAKCLEKQWLTRILVTKTLLEEELDKDEPSLFSVAAFRTAWYGGDVSEGKEPVCDVIGTEETVITAPTILTILQQVATTSFIQLNKVQVMDTVGTSGGDVVSVMTDLIAVGQQLRW